MIFKKMAVVALTLTFCSSAFAEGMYTEVEKVASDHAFISFLEKRIQCVDDKLEKMNYKRGVVLTKRIAEYNLILQKRQDPNRRACYIGEQEKLKTESKGVYLLLGVNSINGELDESDLARSSFATIGLGMDFSDNFALEASYTGGSFNDVKLDYAYSINLLAKYPLMNNTFVPFLTVGAGNVSLADEFDGRLTVQPLNYGGGLDINFTKKWSLNLSHKVISNDKKLKLIQSNINLKVKF